MEKNNNGSKRMILINSLMDMRLSLSVKRIISPKIKKKDLKEIVDGAKAKLSDNILEKEIDKVFDEYFKEKGKNEPQINSNVISLNDMEQMINKESEFKDEGRGISFAKRDNHFNSSTEGKKEAA